MLARSGDVPRQFLAVRHHLHHADGANRLRTLWLSWILVAWLPSGPSPRRTGCRISEELEQRQEFFRSASSRVLHILALLSNAADRMPDVVLCVASQEIIEAGLSWGSLRMPGDVAAAAHGDASCTLILGRPASRSRLCLSTMMSGIRPALTISIRSSSSSASGAS